MSIFSTNSACQASYRHPRRPGRLPARVLLQEITALACLVPWAGSVVLMAGLL